MGSLTEPLLIFLKEFLEFSERFFEGIPKGIREKNTRGTLGETHWGKPGAIVEGIPARISGEIAERVSVRIFGKISYGIPGKMLKKSLEDISRHSKGILEAVSEIITGGIWKRIQKFILRWIHESFSERVLGEIS